MVDSSYSIGDRHIVCQDYALHGTLNDLEYVIVSDGCSGAEHSEIGAQILCHAAKYQLTLANKSGLLKECSLSVLCAFLGNSILKRIDEIRKIYPINQEALEATLFIAFKKGDSIKVFGWGDGTVILNHGSYQGVVEIDHQNKPFYLIGNWEQHFKKWGIEKFEYRYFEDSVDPKFCAWHPFDHTFQCDYNLEHPDHKSLESITICSDGIGSFQYENKEYIPLIDMAPEFVNFKSVSEGFVKKRMFFMKRKAQKEGWTHFDDISSGTILI